MSRISVRILLMVAGLFSQCQGNQKDVADTLMTDYDLYDDPFNSLNVMEGDILVDDSEETLSAGTTTDKNRKAKSIKKISLS